jgi:hypothetical protein
VGFADRQPAPAVAEGDVVLVEPHRQSTLLLVPL